jgi:hypothetical protein
MANGKTKLVNDAIGSVQESDQQQATHQYWEARQPKMT